MSGTAVFVLCCVAVLGCWLSYDAGRQHERERLRIRVVFNHEQVTVRNFYVGQETRNGIPSARCEVMLVDEWDCPIYFGRREH